MKVDDDRFRDNLKYWSKYYSENAKKLSQTKCERTSFIKSHNGELNLSVKRDNIDEALHSVNNPSQEAQEWFSSLNLQHVNVLYVYGVGLGYYYKAAQEWLKEPNHFLIFLEDDLEVIHRLLETQLGSELIRNKQVRLIYFNPYESQDNLWSELVSFFYRYNFELSALNEYGKGNSLLLSQTHARLTFWRNIKDAIADEYEKCGKQFFENFYPNLALLPSSYMAKQLFNKFAGIPAIICGAGPSLSKNLSLLETLRNRALIFAGGTAMNAVNARGFWPHFGLGIDPNPEQFSRIIMNTAFEVPFLYRTRINHKALKSVHAPLLYVNGTVGYEISSWLEEKLHIAGKHVAEGFNVINFSLALAYEMGCNPIILVGTDLAYTDQLSYFPGVKNHPTHSYKMNFRTKTTQEELLARNDIYGQPTLTLWKWISESAWIANFTQMHPETLFINATEGGIGMPGVVNMPLQMVSDAFLNKEYDLDLMVHGEIENSNMPDEVTCEHLLSLLQELKSNLKKSQELCQQLQREFRSQPLSEKNVNQNLHQLESEFSYNYMLKAFEKFHREKDLDREQLAYDSTLSDDVRKASEAEQDAKLYHYLATIAEKNIEFINKSNCKPSQVNAGNGCMHKVQTDQKIDERQMERVNYPSGAKKMEYILLNNKLHGPVFFFTESGRLLGKDSFKEGLQDGESLFFYHSGALYAVRHFQNGLLDGEQKYYYKNGLQKSILPYVQGRLDGTVQLFYPNGKLKRELSFKQSMRNGKEQMWNEDGVLLVDADFVENRPVGVAKTWYDNGILAQEVHFNTDTNTATTFNWSESGVKLSAIESRSDDYFDSLATHTQKLTSSFEGVYTELNKMASTLPFSDKEGTAKGLKEDFSKLFNELQKLDQMNKQMLSEAGLAENAYLEPIWKSPSIKNELQKALSEANEKLAQDMKIMEDALKRLAEEKEKLL